MNLHKSEVKLAVLREVHGKLNGLGVDAEDARLKNEGAVMGLTKAIQTLEDNKKIYHKEVEAGELDPVHLDHILRAIDRDIGALTSMIATLKVEGFRASGRIASFKQAGEYLEREITGEVEKVRTVQTMIEQGEITEEDAAGGVRPRPVPAARDLNERRAKAKAKKKKASRKQPAKSRRTAEG